MIIRIYLGTGEALLIPRRNSWRKLVHIIRKTEKLGEDERVSDGIIVPKKQGNSCGGKYPCY